MSTYNVIVECVNCGFDGNVSIFKGNLISSKACPNCGCKHLNKKGTIKKPEETIRSNKWPKKPYDDNRPMPYYEYYHPPRYKPLWLLNEVWC